MIKTKCKEKGIKMIDLGYDLFPNKSKATIKTYMSLINSGKRLSLLTEERKQKLNLILGIEL